jgi:hypothetical protein
MCVPRYCLLALLLDFVPQAWHAIGILCHVYADVLVCKHVIIVNHNWSLSSLPLKLFPTVTR